VHFFRKNGNFFWARPEIRIFFSIPSYVLTHVGHLFDAFYKALLLYNSYSNVSLISSLGFVHTAYICAHVHTAYICTYVLGKSVIYHHYVHGHRLDTATRVARRGCGKNRPKCWTTYFLPKLIYNCSRGKNPKIWTKMAQGKQSPN
jgi:hypothetical protein